MYTPHLSLFMYCVRTPFSIVNRSVSISVYQHFLLTLTDVSLLLVAFVVSPVVVLCYDDTVVTVIMGWMTSHPVTVLYVYTEYKYV